MTVRNFLMAMKWWIPIELCATDDEFWYKRYKHNEIELAIEEYGDRIIHYWRLDPNYKTRKNGSASLGKRYPTVMTLELVGEKSISIS